MGVGGMAPTNSMLAQYNQTIGQRAKITHSGGKFLHNSTPCRIVLRRELVSVGCSDITPDALRELLREYDKRFTAEEVVLQP